MPSGKAALLCQILKAITFKPQHHDIYQTDTQRVYTDIKDGLKLFIDCLQFTMGHSELDTANPYCVVKKDNLSLLLFQNQEYAEKDRPEFRLVTENIEEAYEKISSTHPEFLHPNLNKITLRPWGAREFALKG